MNIPPSTPSIPERRAFLKNAAALIVTPSLFLGTESVVSAIPARPLTTTQNSRLQYTLRARLTPQETQMARDAERQIVDFFQHVQDLRNQRRQGLIEIDRNRIETFNSAIEELSYLAQGQITISLTNQNLLAETKLWSRRNKNEEPTGIRFTNCRFQSPNGRVNFSGSDLSHSTFNNCSLENTNLVNVVAREASFISSNLTGADLRGSNFTESNFGSTNLTNTICSDRTNFEACEFQEANLRTNTLGLSNLMNAAYLETTTFPAGFNPGKHGMILRAFTR